MKFQNRKSKLTNRNLLYAGFSLIELLIVVGIMAILGVSSIVGMGYLGDILRAREVTGFIDDIVKQEGLKVLRGDFLKSTIHFLPDFIAVEEMPPDTVLIINLNKDLTCAEGYKLDFGSDANLINKDENGETIDAKVVKTGSSECIEFKDSQEIEWNYQMIDGDKFSQIIRFIHFNVQRDNLLNPINITDGADSKIEITAPYGKKLVYDKNGILKDDPNDSDYHVKITVSDKNNNSTDSLILQ